MCLTMDSPRPVPPDSRLARFVDPVETLENPRQVLAGDAAAAVADADLDFLARPSMQSTSTVRPRL